MSKYYKITKTINNNVSFSVDDHGNEIIIFGKGISFGKKAGDLVDKDVIVKTFELKKDNISSMYIQAIQDIDFVYLDLASRIVKLFEQDFHSTLNSIMVISLADHIMNAADNARKGIHAPNSMLYELKRVYPREYKTACKSLQMIKDELQVDLPEDEAGFIILHYLNSKSSHEDAQETVKIIETVCGIIERHFNIELNKSSYKYDRFITHLSFLISRLFYGNDEEMQEDTLLRTLKYKYPESYKCVGKISQYFSDVYDKDMSEEEKGYLIVHINGLLSNAKM